MEKVCRPVQKTQVRSLGQEDPVEEEMAIHCSILAWENPTVRGHNWLTEHRCAAVICQFSSHYPGKCSGSHLQLSDS